MKNILLIPLLLLSLLPSENPKLVLKISNIQKMQGDIKIGIFKSDSSFLKEDLALKNYSIKVIKNTAFITITDLPKGEYAISMFHDENSDNKMNTNFIGIPKEPYGFSNNVKPKMSAPKYKECKFNFSDDKTLEIKLID